MNDRKTASFAMIGLGVMGRNLALNIESSGLRVAVWDRDEPVRAAFAKKFVNQKLVSPKLVGQKGAVQGSQEIRKHDIFVADTLEALVANVARPRRIMLMVTAGKPVDMVIAALLPFLEAGDVIIDGGNTRFQDTRRREQELRAKGLHFFGVGVSGGEEGARYGPALMPGGDPEAYELLRPVFESIAARTDLGPCVAHIGSDGAGHFVKMVHNGIEYADMQLIAESYDFLARGLGLNAERLAQLFSSWNEGPLESFLIEITARIFGVQDERTQGPLVDQVLDKAGQKGTGRWTVMAALDLGVAVPTISAALDARVLSSMKVERAIIAGKISGPGESPSHAGDEHLAAVHDALLAAKVCAYAQGMGLIHAASQEYKWNINLRELGRIWKGGCIIRARFLNSLREAYARDPQLSNLVLDIGVREILTRTLPALRHVVRAAARMGIPVLAFSASLAWIDALRTADLPQNLTQAQRDAFGAHTYLRKDDPKAGPQHTDWLRPRSASKR